MNHRKKLFVLSIVSVFFLFQSKSVFATWSITAVDPKTKQVGIAGASCTDFVYGIAGIAPGKGAIVAQAMSNMEAKSLGEKMLLDGKSPSEVLAAIIDPKFDPDFAMQQYGIVALGFEKESATYSGAKIADWNGSLKGFGVTVQGNILTDESVVKNAFRAFEKTAKNKKSTLADRLMAALEAGIKGDGGDRRCKEQRARSAFVVVETAIPKERPYLLINITGQEAKGENPIPILRRKYEAWRSDVYPNLK